MNCHWIANIAAKLCSSRHHVWWWGWGRSQWEHNIRWGWRWNCSSDGSKITHRKKMTFPQITNVFSESSLKPPSKKELEPDIIRATIVILIMDFQCYCTNYVYTTYSLSELIIPITVLITPHVSFTTYQSAALPPNFRRYII